MCEGCACARRKCELVGARWSRNCGGIVAVHHHDFVIALAKINIAIRRLACDMWMVNTRLMSDIRSRLLFDIVGNDMGDDWTLTKRVLRDVLDQMSDDAAVTVWIDSIDPTELCRATAICRVRTIKDDLIILEVGDDYIPVMRRSN